MRGARSMACTSACSAARRPAAGVTRKTSPALRCFWRVPHRTLSPARRSRLTAGSQCRGKSLSPAKAEIQFFLRLGPGSPLSRGRAEYSPSSFLIPEPAHRALEYAALAQRALRSLGRALRLFLGALARPLMQDRGIELAAVNEDRGAPVEEDERNHRGRQPRVHSHVVAGEFREVPTEQDAGREPQDERDHKAGRDVSEAAPAGRQPFVRDHERAY